VALRVLSLGGETVDTRSATGKLILTIFAGFAQFEREMMLQRGHRQGQEGGPLPRQEAHGSWEGWGCRCALQAGENRLSDR
jgi:DNA invertase Pin-like site-specific DNA recombinase